MSDDSEEKKSAPDEEAGTEGDSEDQAGEEAGEEEESEQAEKTKEDADDQPPVDAPAGDEPSETNQPLSLSESPDEAPTKPMATGDGLFKRRTLTRACLDSFNYVNSISRDQGVKVRDWDRATSYALLLSSIFTVVSMLFEPFAAHRLPLLLASDILIGASIILYLGQRFGILSTFNPRQALLAWQLMMGSTFFGIFLTINLALLIGFIVVNVTPLEATF